MKTYINEFSSIIHGNKNYLQVQDYVDILLYTITTVDVSQPFRVNYYFF